MPLNNPTVPDVLSSQNVVTGSRALGGSYQNTNNTVMLVSVVSAISWGTTLSALSDGSDPPTTEVSKQQAPNSAAAINCPIAFLVSPGNYYKVTGGTLQLWTEWS